MAATADVVTIQDFDSWKEEVSTMAESTYSSVYPVLDSYEAALLLLLGFGTMSVLLALLYNFIRRRVFGDVNSLDQTFDAGGNVSLSLTAVTVAMQVIWPVDFLQSSSIASKFGIAGSFWYSSSVVVNIVLFPLLSLQFKTRAPGAKTFLQVIKARYGAPAHVVYCIFALFINLVVLSVLTVASHALFKALIRDISDELIMLIIATLFGSYSIIGGLGSTFYVSYANGFVTFGLISVYMIYLFYQPDESNLPFGTLPDIYARVVNLSGPSDNEENSYLTFWSAQSIVLGAEFVILSASITFCDQASWQSRIAAKPMQGVLGFMLATFLWFALPSTIGTTSGMLYLAYSDSVNTSLTGADINQGLITPFIAQLALGRAGGIMVLIIFVMLMMGTGSGEIMAVASIIVYDIYQSYISPFCDNLKPGCCVLCGKKEQGESHVTSDAVATQDSSALKSEDKTVATQDSSAIKSEDKTVATQDSSATQPVENTAITQNSTEPPVDNTARPQNSNATEAPVENTDTGHSFTEGSSEILPDICDCPSVVSCSDCEKDLIRSTSAENRSTFGVVTYTCPFHSQYRMYQDSLVRCKSWIMLWLTIVLVPCGLLLIRTGIDLFSINMIAGVFTIHTFPGVLLSVMWVKSTGLSLIIGGFSGLICGVIAWLVKASSLQGGLTTANASEGYSILSGSVVSFVVAWLVNIVLALCTHKIKTPHDVEVVWQKLRDIDNPLNPWAEGFRTEIPDLAPNQRPRYSQLEKCFKKAKVVAIVGSICCIAFFNIVIPAVMASLHVMSSLEFTGYLMTLHIWNFVMTVIIIVLVPVEELKSIFKELRKKRTQVTYL